MTKEQELIKFITEQVKQFENSTDDQCKKRLTAILKIAKEQLNEK